MIIDWAPEDTTESFKKLHPKSRIYEMPLTINDVYHEYRFFEVMGWQIQMICIGIDRKKNIAMYKRISDLHFNGEVY